MNPTTDVILGVGLTAIVGLLAWLLANVNKLLVRHEIRISDRGYAFYVLPGFERRGD